MMRRGAMNGTDVQEMINAAVAELASVENRVPEVLVQKRRWGSFWSRYWCFGSYKNNKRFGHAVFAAETLAPGASLSAVEHQAQPPSLLVPLAPPTSPASFLPSEPPSSAQSPTGLLSVNSVSPNMYSPGGPSSIFAIGPYAHETQLVSPPVFSTFATEPSTAPYTPPESAHLTTPSSPEVPFAQLFEPILQNGEAYQRYPFSQYEFQSYQLQPGSPISHLISPSSGTSSPFPEREFAAGLHFYLEFRTGNPPTLLDLDNIVLHEWESHEVSGEVTPNTVGPRSSDGCLLSRQHSDVAPLPDTHNGLWDDETAIDHRVSFEITAEEIRCVERKPVTLPKAMPESVENVEHTAKENPIKMESLTGETSNTTSDKAVADGEKGQGHLKNQTNTLVSAKEFNFERMDGGNTDEPNIGPNWWANEKVLVKDGGPSKNWWPSSQ